METVLVSCPVCRKKRKREDMRKVVVKNVRYYCEKCYLKKKDEIEEKIAKLHEDGLSEKDRNTIEYAELIDYVCELYNVKAPSNAVLKQIKDYHNNSKFRYKGMLLALKYFHELEGNEVLEDSGVGIIPYVYDKAKDFYAQLIVNKKAGRNEWDVEELTYNTRPKTHRKKKIGIDLNDI